MFWIKVKAEYPVIATKALKSLLPSPTSYLCEAGFSAATATNTRLQSRLDRRNMLRVTLSPTIPPDGTDEMQENTTRAPTDSASWWVVWLFHYVLQCNNNRNKVHNKCNALESSWNYPPPPAPGLQKDCLPQNRCLVPKMLETTALGNKGAVSKGGGMEHAASWSWNIHSNLHAY